MKWKQRNEQTINLTTVHTTVLNCCYFSSNFDVCMRRDGEWRTSNFFYRIVYVLFSGVILTYSLMIFNILTQLPRILCIWAHSIWMSFFLMNESFDFQPPQLFSLFTFFNFHCAIVYYIDIDLYACVCFFLFFLLIFGSSVVGFSIHFDEIFATKDSNMRICINFIVYINSIVV